MDLTEINISPVEPEGAAATAAPLSPLSIKVCCNTKGDQTAKHVKANIARGYTTIEPLPANDRVAVLVGGGPSLADNWHEVAGWRFRGADVFALNGAAKFLNDRGILPQYQVMIDPREKNVDLIGLAPDHIFASQCHPSLFKAVKNPVMMHLVGSAQGLADGTLIGGDITAGLVAMCLAHTLGFRELRLYGYDSSYADDAHHAYSQDQSPQEQKLLEVYAESNGVMQKFTTNFAMAKQAELFPKTAELLVNAGSAIFVHGTGLLPTIAHSLRKPQAQAAE